VPIEVERIVEKIVEVPVQVVEKQVEKIVEVPIEVEKIVEKIIEVPVQVAKREMEVQTEFPLYQQVPHHRNASPVYRDRDQPSPGPPPYAPSPGPSVPTRGSTPTAYSMYTQRTSPDYGMSPRTSVGYWQHRRSHTPSSLPESLLEGHPVSSTPDIETDLVISPEDLVGPYHHGGHHPMYRPPPLPPHMSPQPRVAPRMVQHDPIDPYDDFPIADAETQHAAAMLIQKAFRSRTARRASHVAHRLRRKANRRAGAEARKTVSPQTMGADYSLVGVGRNLKWAFTDSGATISSLKGNDVSEMSIGDHLVAINDTIVDGMSKDDIKIVWKREHGASEYTTLYFRRELQSSASAASPSF